MTFGVDCFFLSRISRVTVWDTKTVTVASKLDLVRTHTNVLQIQVS